MIKHITRSLQTLKKQVHFEMKTQVKHICCNHVCSGQKDVLLVERSIENFQFLCGGHHGEDDGPMLMLEYELIKMDSSLSVLLGLKVNHAAERPAKGSAWTIRYSYGGDVDVRYVKTSNDAFILEHYGMDFGYLPVINLKGFRSRSVKDVKYKAIVLAVIVQVSFDLITAKEAVNYLKRNELYHLLTKKEIEFLLGPGDAASKANETWKSECLSVLLWSLGFEMDLYDAIELSDLNSFPDQDFPFQGLHKGVDHFLRNSNLRLRPEIDLVMALDHFSRLDYICDWYMLNMRDTDLNSAVIYERRYALTWLLFDVAWDSITCDSMV